jgi:hypothetical protein
VVSDGSVGAGVDTDTLITTGLRRPFDDSADPINNFPATQVS